MLETDRRRFIELLKEGFAEYGALLGNSGDEIKQNLKVIWDAHQDVDIKDFKKLIPDIAKQYAPKAELFCCQNTQDLVNKYGKDKREIKRIGPEKVRW